MDTKKLEKIKAQMTEKYSRRRISPGQIIEMVFEALEMVMVSDSDQIEETKKIPEYLLNTDISATESERKNNICASCGKPRNFSETEGFETCEYCGDTIPF